MITRDGAGYENSGDKRLQTEGTSGEKLWRKPMLIMGCRVSK